MRASSRGRRTRDRRPRSSSWMSSAEAHEIVREPARPALGAPRHRALARPHGPDRRDDHRARRGVDHAASATRSCAVRGGAGARHTRPDPAMTRRDPWLGGGPRGEPRPARARGRCRSSGCCARACSPPTARRRWRNFARFFSAARYLAALRNSVLLSVLHRARWRWPVAVPLAFVHARYRLPGEGRDSHPRRHGHGHAAVPGRLRLGDAAGLERDAVLHAPRGRASRSTASSDSPGSCGWGSWSGGRPRVPVRLRRLLRPWTRRWRRRR